MSPVLHFTLLHPFCVFTSAFVCREWAHTYHTYTHAQKHTHARKKHTYIYTLPLYLSLHLSSSFSHWKGGIGWGGMIVLGGSQKTDCLLLSSAHLTLTVTE